MKKMILFVLVLAIMATLFSCGTATEKTDLVSEREEQNQSVEKSDKDSSAQHNNEKQTHEEYEETYHVYAEKGAVITWSDSATGDYRYQYKCEACGQTTGGEVNPTRIGKNATVRTGFMCGNPSCSMWGKSQEAVISCETSGKWVEVID